MKLPKLTHRHLSALEFIQDVLVLLSASFVLIGIISAMNTTVPVHEVFRVVKIIVLFSILLYIVNNLIACIPSKRDMPYDHKRVNFTTLQIAAPNPDFDGNVLCNTIPHTNASRLSTCTNLGNRVPHFVDYDTGDMFFRNQRVNEKVYHSFPAPIQHKSISSIIKLGRFLAVYPTKKTSYNAASRIRNRPVKVR